MLFAYLIRHPRIRTVLCGMATVWFALALLLYPDTIAGGISRGLSICGAVIIPTLFPFLVLGSFISQSGLAAKLGARLERPTRFLFGLPGCCAAGILLAFIGGYPTGAAVIADLLQTGQITKNEAKRMLRFCVCGGPGFVIGTVGANLMGSTALGIVLFAAHVTAAALLGILETPSSARNRTIKPTMTRPAPSAVSAFTESVIGACSSLLSLCGFLIVFSGLLSLLYTLLPAIPVVSTLLSCILEVSCGCIAAAKLTALAPFLLGFTIGFGGVSVHCQIAASLVGTGVITPRFWVSRFLHGTLTALLTVLFLRFVPITVPVFQSTVPTVHATSGSVGISIFLLLLCGIWLLSVDKRDPVPYN